MPIRAVPRRSRTATPTALAPAASRAPEVLTDVEQELNGEAIETFALALGGRDKLAAVLSIASSAPEVEKVVDALADSRMRGMSLRRLCSLAGLTVADLFVAYKKALFTEAHLKSTVIIAAKLPPIVQDVMDKALSDPTVDRQKLALELGHLTEKKAGILVQQNNAVATTLQSHGVGALESLQQAVGELLFSPGRHRHQAPHREEPRPDPLPTSYPHEIDVPLPFVEPESDAGIPDDDPRGDPEYTPPRAS